MPVSPTLQDWWIAKGDSLEPTLTQFEAYDGGIMQAHGWTIMPTQNISTKKFHPVRYYVVEREDARILISHATASQLGLVKVLCTNKAPKCKRHTLPMWNICCQDHHILPKRIFSGTAHNNKTTMEKSRAEGPTSTSHSKGRKWRRCKKLHREVDRSVEHSAVQWQDSTWNSLAAREVQSEPTALLVGLPHPPKEKYSLSTASQQ